MSRFAGPKPEGAGGGARVDLATQVGAVALPSPICLASGTAGRGAELAPYLDLARLGAVVTKSLSARPWPGNPPPRLTPAGLGMLNAVGLQNPGVEQWLEEDLPDLEATGARVVASIWGERVEDFATAAALLRGAPPCVVAVEVNVSCPNLADRRRMFAHSPSATAEAVEAAAACGLPLWAKLSPNVADLVGIAEAAAGAGAAAVVLVNTLLGMVLDLDRRRPVLGHGGGGLSGPPLHPVAVRAVFDVSAVLPELPVVGVGGVLRGEDAVELLLAGASAVEVGTASFADPASAERIQRETVGWCRRHGVDAVRTLVGAAHEGAPLVDLEKVPENP